MTSDDTRLAALIRVMTDEQKRKMIEAAKNILMATCTQKAEYTGGEIYAQHPDHP